MNSSTAALKEKTVKEKTIKEKTFSIHELAGKYGISPHTLRYYEKLGLVTGVKRDSSGRRRYSEWHCLWIKYLLCFKATGMPLEEIKRYLVLLDDGDRSVSGRKHLLEEHRSRVMKKLEELRTSLGLIEDKINYYEDIEKELKKIKKSL